MSLGLLCVALRRIHISKCGRPDGWTSVYYKKRLSRSESHLKLELWHWHIVRSLALEEFKILVEILCMI